MSILGIESCNKDKCLTGNEYRVGVNREVENFTEIDVKLSAVIELIKDSTPYIEFVVEGNLEQYIATPVIDSVLTISLSDCFKEHQNIVIKVHYDTLHTITISGPGDVKSSQIMEQDSMNLHIKSTGDIALTSNIKNLYTVINGTGNVTINGQIENHTVEINNSGGVGTYQAMTQTATINSTGSGNMYLRVKNSITGSLTNSGNIYYKRNPIVNVVVSGTGKVIDDN